MKNRRYIAVVQCQIVKQRCSGYFCEKSYTDRTGGFRIYSKGRQYRTIYMDCGGCCGRAILRKLQNLKKMLRREEKIGKEAIAVQLSSCITKDNYHAPPCPHLDYMKAQIGRLGLACHEDTHISARAEKRRRKGIYRN